MVIIAADSNVVFEDVEDYETNKAVVAEWVAQNDLKAVIGPLIPELGQRLAPELGALRQFIFPEVSPRHPRSLQAHVVRSTSFHRFNNSETSLVKRWLQMGQALQA